jgi:xylulokinase
MPRSVLVGIDSGTQSTKALALDAESGEIVAEGRGVHSGASLQHPSDWWQAMGQALAPIVASELTILGVSVSGQQHGCVLMDASGVPVREAPLWNETSAAPDAERLNSEADFASAIGSRLVSAFTIAKLAHLKRTEPDAIDRTHAVGLPHDWLNLHLTGRLTTDRGDASGSGWWSPATNDIRRDLLALAIGEDDARRLALPDVLASNQIAGTITSGASAALGLPAGVPVGPGTGDNMAAALGIGASPGSFVISLGTSGTAYAVSETPTHDPTGIVCGFADATDRFLPLVCLINCTRTVDAIAKLCGLDPLEALDLAQALAPGAGGLLLEPWFGGERTPNLPDATATLHGMTLDHLSPAVFVRAAIDAVAAGLASGIDHLRANGIAGDTVTLVGGGSQHPVWQQAIADATQLPVVVRGGREHAARGAAIQIGAILRGVPVSQLAAEWKPLVLSTVQPRSGMRERFQLERRQNLARARQAG